MILYLDASALAKLYVDEDGSEQVREALSEAQVAGTSELTYVEVCSALARRFREGAFDSVAYRRVLKNIDAEWSDFSVVAVSTQLVRKASLLVARYPLRAYDAVHLASSLLLQSGTSDVVTFACWDRQLLRSAAQAKLRTLGPN